MFFESVMAVPTVYQTGSGDLLLELGVGVKEAVIMALEFVSKHLGNRMNFLC